MLKARRFALTLLLLVALTMTFFDPVSAQNIPIQADSWNRAAMEWIHLIQAGEYEAAAGRIDPAVPEGALGATQIETIWGQLGAQLGALVSLDPGPIVESQGYHIVDLPAAFENQAVVLRVVLTDALLVSGFFIRPPEPPAYEAPEYVDEAAFSEVDLTVGSDPWTLPGVLSVPKGEGPFPVVVLVHGSGPNDMDETVGGNRPFRDLAWGLASKGIAVLRYDKRTKMHGGALPADLGLEEEVIEDALLALDLVRGREEVDPDRVFLLGHSLGAMLASDIGLRDGRLAGVMILAAPARPFLPVLKGQLEYIASLEEDPDSPARAQVDSLVAEVERAARGEMGPDEPILGVRRGYWQELEEVDPVGAAQRLTIPTLVLQGGRDYQSTEEDFRIWEEALSQKAGVTLKLYPDLNHLFGHGEGMATPAEYSSEVKHVAPEVVGDLVRWILGGKLPNS
jgi:alpha-beta hydrolase superfamily lysophospholipase